MYVCMCVCVCNKKKVFVRPHLTDVIGVKESGHRLSGGGGLGGGVGLGGLGSW